MYFRSLFEGKMKRDGDFVWSCLANAVADLPAPELLDHLRRAYADGLADEAVADLAELEKVMREPDPWARRDINLVNDTVADLEGWACFQPREPQRKAAVKPAPSAPAHHEPRLVPPRSSPKVGRNDPCPCGSGKKHKKCCGAN